MFGLYMLTVAVDWNKGSEDGQYVSVEHVTPEIFQQRNPTENMVLSWLIEREDENETDIAVMISFPMSMNPSDALLAFNKFLHTNTNINTNPPPDANLN